MMNDEPDTYSPSKQIYISSNIQETFGARYPPSSANFEEREQMIYMAPRNLHFKVQPARGGLAVDQ